MDKYNEFANRYKVRDIQVSRDRRNIDYYNYYNTTASYYADREEFIEMEMPRKSFEHLVDIDNDFNKMWREQRDEMYMRKQHPAIAEAYEKYRMLLELYK